MAKYYQSPDGTIPHKRVWSTIQEDMLRSEGWTPAPAPEKKPRNRSKKPTYYYTPSHDGGR